MPRARACAGIAQGRKYVLEGHQTWQGLLAFAAAHVRSCRPWRSSCSSHIASAALRGTMLISMAVLCAGREACCQRRHSESHGSINRQESPAMRGAVCSGEHLASLPPSLCSSTVFMLPVQGISQHRGANMKLGTAQDEDASTGVTAADFAAAGWNKWLASSTAALVRCMQAMAGRVKCSFCAVRMHACLRISPDQHLWDVASTGGLGVLPRLPALARTHIGDRGGCLMRGGACPAAACRLFE